MPFNYDSRGVKPSTINEPLPAGEYTFEIVKAEEGFTQKGLPMVKLMARVVEGECKGRGIFHNVTFLPNDSPGAGIAIHFLKSIGEPWEEAENLDIDCTRWVGRQFVGNVIQEPYKKPDGSQIMTSKIKGVEPVQGIPF